MKIKKFLRISTVLTMLGLTALAAGAQDVSKMKSGRMKAVPAASTVVAGIMTYNENWSASAPEAGVYYIEVKPDGAITPQYRSDAMADVVSALKKDNVVYTAEATSDFRYYYRQMNASDWSTIGSRQEIDVEDVPAGWTYDATLGKAYGSFWNDNYGGFSYFGSFNLTSATWTSIDKNQRDERDIFALAADGKGTIYALFGAFNYLATIDPVTGQVERIKTTGFEIDTNFAEGRISSMCYDELNDRLIATVAETLGWGANKTYQSGLYTLNPHTGEVTKIMSLPGNACFAGLYVVDESQNPEAPGSPSDLRVNVEGISTTGTVSFTMPTKTAGGTDIEGTLSAIINLNGTETTIQGLTKGQQVTSPQLNFITGVNGVRVTAADDQRRGGSQAMEFWAGEDTPLPATEVKLTVDDGAATITWTAPSGGAHDGRIEPANIKYRIVRMPENVTVAEAATGNSFTDRNLNPEVKIIYYTVAAYNGSGSAQATESNRCPSAGTFTVPFTENFDTADDFGLWTVENVNGGSTWTYSNGSDEQCAEYKYDDEKKPGDDWLISPPIKMEAGKTYKLSYKWRVYGRNYPESFEICLGTGARPEDMTRTVASHLKVSNTGYQSADQAVAIDTDGVYFIGVHCISDPYMYILHVDDITLVEMDNRVPATVADLKVTPAPNGQRAATVTFTVPDKDNKGENLESVSWASITRNGAEIARLTDVAPGQGVTYEDNTVSADGMMKYGVTCANMAGAGVEAVCEAYVGIDAPGAVGNLTISESGSHPHLQWTVPVEGVNGGWFDASTLTYRIVRSDGEVVAEACTATEYTDNGFSAPSQGQDAVWYLVTPYSGTTKGAYAQSELLLMGTPYPAPLTETFANADMKYYPWISQSPNAINYAWTLDNMGYNPSAADQNGDRGLATFHSVGEPAGTVSYFYSPKIDISALENPALNFYLYHAEGEGDGAMELVVSTGTDTFSPMEGAAKIERTAASGWKRYSVSLEPYKTAPWIRIGFKGTGDGVADIYLDNVSVTSQLPVDMAMTALKAPSRIAAGEDVKCSATVLNAGTGKVDGATLAVKGTDGTTLHTAAVPTLESGRETTVEFTIPASATGKLAFTAEVTAEGDGDTSNNLMKAEVTVVDPVVSAPANLKGSIADDTVTLTWDDPMEKGAVTDDVESYTDFAVDGIGEWTMWDGDYDVTYMINTSYGDYPNSTTRKAFQVCNADLLGINVWDEGKPHSGNKMFMALCSYTYVNNDWLISPELNGKPQWIRFHARSFTLQNTPAERMRVWYSTSDNDPANFTEITTSYVELPGTWQQYSYYLPEGAKYFAINCVSDGAFAMFVDDISFNDLSVPTWELDHYDIYLDGEKIGESEETTYQTTTTAEKGEYTVKAVYDRGESPMSNPVTLKSAALGAIGAEDGDVRYFDIHGFKVKNPQSGSILIKVEGGKAAKTLSR